LKYLESIKRQGIIPTDTTNFEDIEHNDKIFITLNLEKALFHANKASSENESFPIILKHKIPDPSKLVLDYDIAIEFLGQNHPETRKLGYDEIEQSEYINQDDKTEGEKIDLNMKLGIFGYVGRIPSSFIEDVFIDLNTLNQNWGIFDEEFGYSEEFNSESEIWNEFEDVDMWSELSLSDATRRISDIEDEFRAEFEEEDEDDWDEDED
tara:strand:+ start:68 stop:694 length:627 start_codon:yes stop_codon:yes gene_type:complete